MTRLHQSCYFFSYSLRGVVPEDAPDIWLDPRTTNENRQETCGMPSVMGPSSESVSPRARSVAHLKPYQFTSENNPAKTNPKAHRQRGSRNAETIYLESLPVKARQWVKSTAPAVLVDARKIALPIDSDVLAPTVMLTRLEIVAELQRRGVPIPQLRDSSAPEALSTRPPSEKSGPQ